MASGIPSSRRHIAAMSGTLASVSAKPGDTAAARSTNRRTASESAAAAQRRRYGHRLHLVRGLAGYGKWFPACGEHPELRSGGQEVGDDLGGGRDHVLAVVHQQQARHSAGDLAQHVAQRPSGLRYDTQGPGHGIGDKVGRDGCQIRESGAVRELVGQLRGDVQCEAGLAHTAGSDERDQPMAGGSVVSSLVSFSRPMRLVSGIGSATSARADRRSSTPRSASAVRSLTPSFRSREAMWLSTVRTETYKPLGDLAVAQPLGDRREHLGLPLGHAGAGQPLGHADTVGCHARIVRHGAHRSVRRSRPYRDPYGARMWCRRRSPTLVGTKSHAGSPMHDRHRHDVVVVGARAAGAATALLLARLGHDVVLLDRAVFPADTLSTHQIARTGVVQLHRWGLLAGGAGQRRAGDPPGHLHGRGRVDDPSDQGQGRRGPARRAPPLHPRHHRGRGGGRGGRRRAASA